MSFTASLSRITDCYNMVFLFETVCLLATVHSTWIPHFPQNSEEFFFTPKIYQYFQSPFFSEFSHLFLRGYFTDHQKINSANWGGFPPRNSGEAKLWLSMTAVINCIKLGNFCALV